MPKLPSIDLTLGDCGLQLPTTAQNANLLPQLYRSPSFGPYPDQPPASLAILLVLPQRLDPRAEDVDAILLPDLVPWHVVEDAIECRDVRDMVDQ